METKDAQRANPGVKFWPLRCCVLHRAERRGGQKRKLLSARIQGSSFGRFAIVFSNVQSVAEGGKRVMLGRVCADDRRAQRSAV